MYVEKRGIVRGVEKETGSAGSVQPISRYVEPCRSGGTEIDKQVVVGWWLVKEKKKPKTPVT